MRLPPLVVVVFLETACSKTDPGSATAPASSAPITKSAPVGDASAAAGTVGPMRVLAEGALPKGITPSGKVQKIVGWTDTNGENVAVFSRRETSKKSGGEILESGYIEVQHIIASEPPKVLRTVKDMVEKCDLEMMVEFRDAALEVTDLDKDGIGELTFAYAKNCASDYTPADLKLLTLENGDKYILRGWTRREAIGSDQAMGGEFVVDPSFKSGPPAFFEHAKTSWLKVRPHSAEDAVLSKKHPTKPCTAVPWKGSEFPEADVKGVTGKLGYGEGSDLTGKMEKFLTLALDTPICADGDSIDEVQIAPVDLSTADQTKLWSLVGKRMTVSGIASRAVTIHDHRPIVIAGPIKPL